MLKLTTSKLQIYPSLRSCLVDFNRLSYFMNIKIEKKIFVLIFLKTVTFLFYKQRPMTHIYRNETEDIVSHSKLIL